LTAPATRWAIILAAALALSWAAPAGAAAPEYKVVGGSATPITSIPWQVAIVDGSGTPNQQYCGGSLLRPRVVLTAAHCLVEAGSPFFRGSQYIVAGATRWSDPAQGVRIPIVAAAIDPAFTGGVGGNDAAVLTLASPVPPASGATIRLAGPNERKLWKPGVPATISGWGYVTEAGPRSLDLRSAVVPILSDNYCGAVYAGLFDVHSMLCAGYVNGGIDDCFGDSGGPLTVPARGGKGGKVREVGLASFGSGCAEPNAPGVYSRVGQNPLQKFIQAAVNLTPDPGNVIGSGGVCAGIKGKKGQKCRCKQKPKSKQRRKCLKKLDAKATKK
jgi:secreted trypsin-like serine protease